MAGKFVLKMGATGRYHFVLKARNGEVILSSQHYATKAGAEGGIQSVRTNATIDARFERKIAANGQPMFSLRAGNSEIIGTSETYSSDAARERGVTSVKVNAPDATLEEITVSPVSLKSIDIENYRGFFQKSVIAFAQPDGNPGSGLTVLVGPNNSGKSTVLNALQLAFAPRPIDVEQRRADKIVNITVVETTEASRTVSNPDFGAMLTANDEPEGWMDSHSFRFATSRRSWSAFSHQPSTNAANYWSGSLGLNNPNAGSELFVSRVADLKSDERAMLHEMMQRVLPDLCRWKIEMSRGQTYIQYETATGQFHSSDLFGDGMSSVFRIALTLFDSVPGGVAAFDEPELSLHPQAQKALADLLSEFAKDRRIIVATHSPHLLNWNDVRAGAKIYRVTQEQDGIVARTPTELAVKNILKLNLQWQKPHLLDAVARELFFAKEVVFFEGQEDVGLLRQFAVDQKRKPLPTLGYGAGGAENIRHFLQLACDLGVVAAAVFDGDKEREMKRVQADFPNCFFALLPVSDIRDKPKRDCSGKEVDEVVKEGLFDRRGVVKEEHIEFLNALFDSLNKFFENPTAMPSTGSM